MVGGGRGHRDICKETQKSKVILSAASAPDDCLIGAKYLFTYSCPPGLSTAAGAKRHYRHYEMRVLLHT